VSTQVELKLPTHLGFILDGNRRWAKEQNLPTLKGHRQGLDNLEKIAIMAIKGGVKYISAFLFSTDNWNRSQSEVSYLMKLIIRLTEKDINNFKEEGIKIVFVGAREGLPKNVLTAIDKAVRETKSGKTGTLALCINYGGQQEIVDAAKKLIRFKTDPNRLSVRDFEQALYAPELPPLDLVVRTSGEFRTSGFMLWRAAYAEYVFVNKYWPDFTKQDLKMVLTYYAKRQRRFGT
jgi:undecaprenyl diphosphate synthase